MKEFLLIFHFILLTISFPGYSQHNNNTGFPEIRIYVAEEELTRLRKSGGKKIDLHQPLLIINQDTVVASDIHSRGASTSKFARKSLSVDLEDAFSLTTRRESIKIKKFDLLNLVMDKNLWHNRWAFINLAELNLFPLFNSYCKLWINDQPQGIYFLVEKPTQYQAQEKSPYMLRRGANHRVEQEYSNKIPKEEAKQYKEMYLGIYRNLGKYSNKELSAQLQTSLQLDHYFKWLGFNYLILNGDYSDEIFFYIQPDSRIFSIIPWDYDDIFRREPHEGAKARQTRPLDKLLFSMEDELDQRIAEDEWLYAEYCSTFKELLLNRDMDAINRTFEQVLNELAIISNDQAMNEASAFLEKEPFSIEKVKEDLQIASEFLLNKRIVLLKALEK